MAFARGSLSEEQRARVEANRKKALARLQARQNGTQLNTGNRSHNQANSASNGSGHIHPGSSSSSSSYSRPSNSTTSQIMDPSTTRISASFVDVHAKRPALDAPSTSTDSGSTSTIQNDLKRPRLPELTPEQRKRLDENRQRALEMRKRRAENNRDASTSAVSNGIANADLSDGIRLNNNNKNDSGFGDKQPSRFDPPAIRKQDYIEFDFSTMKDSRGGFLNDETAAGRMAEGQNEGETLEEWKERQRKQQTVYQELPPPMDIEKAPKCYECGSMEIDPNLYKNFWNVRACRKCMREKPEKYSLLTKTECREDYLLTDPELKDVALLPRIEKPNPHGFSRMQLFLRFQVEEFAWKKWGGPDKLDEEWERREANRIKRRDKKYNDQLKEMRKKTRAEEYTRKLRNGQSLGERHVHEWSAPLKMRGEENMVKRRCVDCGMEMEEVLI
ncbi:XPA protein C-terminus-domain-containing protein [Scheffersomyces xylosifermentans]|uniref:XPA protein C-terminus-domain-containing protein n=1 Tax=Scheffersomyces xylosifermentans TaxID=1304137 RepID=UPI00315D4DFC